MPVDKKIINTTFFAQCRDLRRGLRQIISEKARMCSSLNDMLFTRDYNLYTSQCLYLRRRLRQIISEKARMYTSNHNEP